MKAKNIYWVIPIDESKIEIYKYNPNTQKREKIYLISGGRCDCEGYATGGHCRHIDMIYGDFRFCDSKKNPYCVSKDISERVSFLVAESFGCIKRHKEWEPSYDYDADGKEINHIFIKVKQKYQTDLPIGTRCIGFLLVNKRGITVTVGFME